MKNQKKTQDQKKESKKKSFYFEDYTESEEITISNKNNTIKVSLSRVAFIFFVFLSLTFIFCAKIIYLSFYKNNLLISENFNFDPLKIRADIVDRNNVIIARNADIYSAGIQPRLVEDKKKLLLDLKFIFPAIEVKRIK